MENIIYKRFTIIPEPYWSVFNKDWNHNYNVLRTDIRTDSRSLRFVRDLTEAKAMIDMMEENYAEIFLK